MMGGMGFGIGSLGWLGMFLNLAVGLAVVGGLAWLVVWGTRRASAGAADGSPPVSPRQVVQARYARGELTREQYHQVLSDLDRRGQAGSEAP